jgi:hypothetical protein
MRNLVLLLFSIALLAACNTDTSKKSQQPVREYSVVGTWELMFTQDIDGADTTLNLMTDDDIIIRKVVAANNTFTYTFVPKVNEYDLELTLRGDYKIEEGLYYEYLRNDTEMDQLMVELVGGTSKIYKTVILNDDQWVLSVLNLGGINRSLNQYWKRI